MTYRDHTKAWQRLRNLVTCLCGDDTGGGCHCRGQGIRGRLRVLWRTMTRRSNREAARLRREVARLRAELAVMEERIEDETAQRRQAEYDLAAERYTKRALLDTMTPGRRRGKA